MEVYTYFRLIIKHSYSRLSAPISPAPYIAVAIATICLLSLSSYFVCKDTKKSDSTLETTKILAKKDTLHSERVEQVLSQRFLKKTLLIPPYSFLIPLEPPSNLAGAKSSIGSSQLVIWLETPFLGGIFNAAFRASIFYNILALLFPYCLDGTGTRPNVPRPSVP